MVGWGGGMGWGWEYGVLEGKGEVVVCVCVRVCVQGVLFIAQRPPQAPVRGETSSVCFWRWAGKAQGPQRKASRGGGGWSWQALAGTDPPHSYLQWLSPAHTPQSSTTPVLQHRPRGGSGVVQHVPWASTATPGPPHTPHASRVPAGQHLPPRSTDAPAGQHSPVPLSTSPGQQAPAASTTALVQGGTSPSRGTRGTLHIAPPQLGPHPQVRVPGAHTQWSLGQSAEVVHGHAEALAGTQGAVRGGRPAGPTARSHAASGAGPPVAATHVTLRDWTPWVMDAQVAPVVAGTHSLQSPTRQDARVEGQGNRLQGRVMEGAVW
jgi:hypothetical protein